MHQRLGCALVQTHVNVDYVLVSGMKILILPEDPFPVTTKVFLSKQNIEHTVGALTLPFCLHQVSSPS